MSRISPLSADDVPELHDVFEIKRRSLGFVPNSALTMARWPDLARAYAALTAAIASTKHIGPGLSSLVFLMASSAAGCMYCVAHSASKANTKGVLESKIQAVWEFESSPMFNEAERAALRLAQAAGLTPPAVTDEHFNQLRLHFNDDAIVELVGVIAFSGFMNRWNATIGTELEDGPRAFAQRLLSAQGWRVGAHEGHDSVRTDLHR